MAEYILYQSQIYMQVKGKDLTEMAVRSGLINSTLIKVI